MTGEDVRQIARDIDKAEVRELFWSAVGFVDAAPDMAIEKAARHDKWGPSVMLVDTRHGRKIGAWWPAAPSGFVMQVNPVLIRSLDMDPVEMLEAIEEGGVPDAELTNDDAVRLTLDGEGQPGQTEAFLTTVEGLLHRTE